jgi:muramidase (phage lysozyme)
MAGISEKAAGGRNVLAFLDIFAFSEGTATNRYTRDDGYDIIVGRVATAIDKVLNIWPSLPGAGYGQREHTLDDLLARDRAADGSQACARLKAISGGLGQVEFATH